MPAFPPTPLPRKIEPKEASMPKTPKPTQKTSVGRRGFLKGAAAGAAAGGFAGTTEARHAAWKSTRRFFAQAFE